MSALVTTIETMLKQVVQSSYRVDPNVASLSEVQRLVSQYVTTPDTLRVDETKHIALVLQLILKDGSWFPTFGPEDRVSIFQLTQQNSEIEFKITFMMAKSFGNIDTLEDEKYDYNMYINELSRALREIPCASEMIQALQKTQEESKKFESSIQRDALDNVCRAFVSGKLDQDSFAATTLFSYRSLPPDNKVCENQSVLTACSGFVQTFADRPEIAQNERVPLVYIALVGNQEEFEASASTSERYEAVKKSLPGGSCTMLMTLVFYVLEANGYYVMHLENYGGVAGCKCYTASAESNSLYAFNTSDGAAKLFVKHYIPRDVQMLRFTDDNCYRFERRHGLYRSMYFISPYVLFNIIKNSESVLDLKDCLEYVSKSKPDDPSLNDWVQRANDVFAVWKTSHEQTEVAPKRRRQESKAYVSIRK